jgi:hypothetical protein
MNMPVNVPADSRPHRATRHLTIPFLAAGLAAFWIAEALALRRAGVLSPGALGLVWAWLGMLAAWGVASAWLSLSGRYGTPRFFALMPGLWLPAVPVTATAGLLLASPVAREAGTALSQGIPDAGFVLLQAMRLAALGSVLKARAGELPRSFGLGLGVPDTLFGLSALGIALAGAGTLPDAVLLAWNLAGAAILLAALPALQASLPGPLQRFHAQPDGRVLFAFPMVLAPTLLAPLFLLANLAHAAGLALRMLSG